MKTPVNGERHYDHGCQDLITSERWKIAMKCKCDVTANGNPGRRECSQHPTLRSERYGSSQERGRARCHQDTFGDKGEPPRLSEKLR